MSRATNQSLSSEPVRFSGDILLNESIINLKRWQLKELSTHLSDVGGAGDFTLTINSASGIAYNLNIFKYDMTLVRDLVWIPSEKIIIEANDELVISWINANGKTYGIEIRWDFAE